MYTMQQIKEANRALGHHWFDPGAMRFFGTRLCPATVKGLPDGGALFVSSEQPPHGPRGYGVRRVHPNGAVETLGEVCQYRTRKAALAALLRERARLSGGVAP